jgi:ATP-dependent DNA ligase
MLAKSSDVLPDGQGWIYEPKWDGFRCIVFRDGDDIELTSRNERPFTRYFPELIGPMLEQLPDRCVLDGEIVIPTVGGQGLDFDALLQRIHPAESRVRRLAAETPASFVAFDLVALGDRSLLDEPLVERRRLLVESMHGARAPLHLTPSTEDVAVATDWFSRFEGAGLDGIVAKRLGGPYTPDERTMVKVKHRRTADCAVAGYRLHKDGLGVGSFLLGLYDDDGRLQHIGVATGFTAKARRALLEEIEPLTIDALDGHPWRDWADAMAHSAGRMPGAQSRWNAKKDLSWVPLRIERVAEVGFTQMQGNRLRHAAQFLHWRPDREPASCTYHQLDVADPVAFSDLFPA